MSRNWFALAALLLLPGVLFAEQVSGTYLETRTCQVYTGPCFANAETGMAGREAVMAWNIEAGSQGNIDLSGLSVVMVLRASDTLGHQGIDDAKQVRSTIIVDDKASDAQRTALVAFAKQHAGKAGREVVRVDAAPIQMSLDTHELKGNLAAGQIVKLSTRKAKSTDCICTNEVAYYPPLAKVDQFAAGVSIEAEYKGRGLGTSWSTPNSRSAYMGTFQYE